MQESTCLIILKTRKQTTRQGKEFQTIFTIMPLLQTFQKINIEFHITNKRDHADKPTGRIESSTRYFLNITQRKNFQLESLDINLETKLNVGCEQKRKKLFNQRLSEIRMISMNVEEYNTNSTHALILKGCVTKKWTITMTIL